MTTAMTEERMQRFVGMMFETIGHLSGAAADFDRRFIIQGEELRNTAAMLRQAGKLMEGMLELLERWRPRE